MLALTSTHPCRHRKPLLVSITLAPVNVGDLVFIRDLFTTPQLLAILAPLHQVEFYPSTFLVIATNLPKLRLRIDRNSPLPSSYSQIEIQRSGPRMET